MHMDIRVFEVTYLSILSSNLTFEAVWEAAISCQYIMQQL